MDFNKPVTRANHPQRRRSDENVPVDRRHPDPIEARMDEFERKLMENTALTRRSVEMFSGLEAGIRVLGGLGTFAKWLAPIVTLGVALWAIISGKDVTK